MKKMLLGMVCLSGMAVAQVSILQPQNWDQIFERKFSKEGTLFRPLSQYPRPDLQSFDARKSASGKIAGLFGQKYGVTEERLYQSVVYWKNCPYSTMIATEFETLANALKRMGYTSVAKKNTDGEQLAVWNPKNRAYPSIAFNLNMKCGGPDNVAVLTVFQIGEERHLSYGKLLSDRMLGIGMPVEADTRIQLRTPLGPVRPDPAGLILAELYNTTAQSISVTLRVDVRNAAGRVINSYTVQPVEVKGNSPAQAKLSIEGEGGADALVRIESIK
jgi:hypothetical protein